MISYDDRRGGGGGDRFIRMALFFLMCQTDLVKLQTYNVYDV